MSDPPLSLELLAYRLAQAEIVQTAMQVELHELRREREKFVRREDVEHAAAIRRQWPAVLAGVTVALCSVASIVVQVVR